MTKAKPKSAFHKGTAIPNALVDELMHHLEALPTQEDLFGPEGIVKQLSAALIERCLEAELTTVLATWDICSGNRLVVHDEGSFLANVREMCV